MKPQTQIKGAEKRWCVLLLLLCLLLLGVAVFIERRSAPLARYSGVVPLGGSGFVRLRADCLGSGPDSSWSIGVTRVQPPLQMHSDAPRSWKVEFVEELPQQNGLPSVGVKVSVPHHARHLAGADGFVSWRHDCNGAPLLYTGSFRVIPCSCPTPHA